MITKYCISASVRSVFSGDMDCIKYITEFVIVFLSCVLVTNQMLVASVTECPLVDNSNTTDLVTVHNITRSAPCKTGKGLSGCCVERMYCEYNTSNIDLTLFGPPGFRMPCGWKEVCCPHQYIQPIPLYNSTQNSDDNDLNMNDDIEDF